MQNHQIDQLKEEISGKDLALVKEHFDHMKVCSPQLPADCPLNNEHVSSAYEGVPQTCPADRSASTEHVVSHIRTFRQYMA